MELQIFIEPKKPGCLIYYQLRHTFIVTEISDLHIIRSDPIAEANESPIGPTALAMLKPIFDYFFKFTFTTRRNRNETENN